MALDRFLKLPQERRTFVLETAARMFAELGYEGTSYNELLREIGMGKSQAYYYFSDKADLFTTSIAAIYEDFYESCRQLPEPECVDGFWDQVTTLHRMGFDYQAANPIAARLSLAALRSPVRFEIADRLMAQDGTTRQQHRYWVRLGRRLGAIRRDLAEELLVEMSINQALFVDEWFARHHMKSTATKRRKLALQFTDTIKRMMQP